MPSRPLAVLPALMLALTPATQVFTAMPAAARDLAIGMTQFPSTFHPAIGPMVVKSYVLAMARRPITVYDKNWKLVCMLCTKLPRLEDGTAREVVRPDGTRAIDATFTLDSHAVWGDGTPITTRDVLFTWEVGRHPQSGVTNAALFAKDIVGIDALDEKSFVIHWDKFRCTYDAINDFELLPEHLERPVFQSDPASYQNRTHYDTDTANPGLWFGPYRIAKVETGATIVLEPNPKWWGRKPAFEHITVRAIENTAALEASLLSGQVDAIPGEVGLPLDQALALETRQGGRFAIQYKPGLSYEHIDLNLDNPVLADVRVRRALLMALDREQISRRLFAGKQPVADNIVNPLDAAYSPDTPKYGFDPKRAAALLDEAGFTTLKDGVRQDAQGRRLSLEIASTAGNRNRELIQQVLQSQWKAIGVEARIANEPPRVLFGQTLRERRFKSMALFAWISAPENIPRTILHSSMIPTADNGWSGQNVPGYRNPEMDKVLDDLEVVCAPEDNRKLWAQLETLYGNDLPELPLFFRADPFILPKWLKGVEPTGHQYPSTLWIEDWSVNTAP